MQHTHLFMPLALISAMATVQQVYAAEDYIVRDIKVDGLVRLTPAIRWFSRLSNVLLFLKLNLKEISLSLKRP